MDNIKLITRYKSLIFLTARDCKKNEILEFVLKLCLFWLTIKL